MALTTRQGRLYQRLKSSMPSWAFATATGELWESIAVVFDTVREQMRSWVDATYILRAQGTWLDVHANERGTQRKLGESDPSLRERLRTPEDAITIPALQTAADAILSAMGGPTGTVVESLRMESMHFGGDANDTRGKWYWGRGYRWGRSVWGQYPGGSAVWPGDTSATGRRGSHIIVILPYGTTTAARDAVNNMIRIKKAGGFSHAIEVRAVP
ncbi:MAG: hypothetical protein KAY59_10090 [Acidobacteria bacterium]|nr:hypothetical protein [Acidobacteriota bacterium]